MIEQQELILCIQQYLSTKERIKTRLVNSNWNYSLCDDDNLWKQLLVHLKTNVLINSYLIQHYSFENTDRYLVGHYLFKQNKQMAIGTEHNPNKRRLLYYQHQSQIAEDTVSKWLNSHVTKQPSEYEKYLVVVNKLNCLQKQMPTPEVAEKLLIVGYSLEPLFSYLFIISLIIGLYGCGLAEFNPNSISYKQDISFYMVILGHLSCISSLFQFILLYLSHTMSRTEKYLRIIMLLLHSIHSIGLLFYYNLLIAQVNSTTYFVIVTVLFILNSFVYNIENFAVMQCSKCLRDRRLIEIIEIVFEVVCSIGTSCILIWNLYIMISKSHNISDI
jgi:hypothetical protein